MHCYSTILTTTDVSFGHIEVENIFHDKNIDFDKLCKKLLSIPPPGGSLRQYSMMGIKLWLLTSPKRTWVNFSWGLYMSHMDDALKIAKPNIIIEGGKICRCKFFIIIIT